MNICRTVELREAPVYLTEDWFQVGVSRGLLLGMLYPWLAGFVSGLPEGVDEAVAWALSYGIYGTLVGLIVGPFGGGLVGLIPLALDRRVSFRATPRCVAAVAIAIAAGALTIVALCLAIVMGAEVGDGWTFAWLTLIAGPAVLGLTSLVVPPPIERPSQLAAGGRSERRGATRSQGGRALRGDRGNDRRTSPSR